MKRPSSKSRVSERGLREDQERARIASREKLTQLKLKLLPLTSDEGGYSYCGEFGSMRELMTAYAESIHEWQTSEYDLARSEFKRQSLSLCNVGPRAMRFCIKTMTFILDMVCRDIDGSVQMYRRGNGKRKTCCWKGKVVVDLADLLPGLIFSGSEWPYDDRQVTQDKVDPIFRDDVHSIISKIIFTRGFESLSNPFGFNPNSRCLRDILEGSNNLRLKFYSDLNCNSMLRTEGMNGAYFYTHSLNLDNEDQVYAGHFHSLSEKMKNPPMKVERLISQKLSGKHGAALGPQEAEHIAKAILAQDDMRDISHRYLLESLADSIRCRNAALAVNAHVTGTSISNSVIFIDGNQLIQDFERSEEPLIIDASRPVLLRHTVTSSGNQETFESKCYTTGMMLKQCSEAPVVYIDGNFKHLLSSKECLLGAFVQAGVGFSMPLAFAVVSGESAFAFMFFLWQISLLCFIFNQKLPDFRGIMGDCLTGLFGYSGQMHVRQLFLDSPERMACYLHVRKNVEEHLDNLRSPAVYKSFFLSFVVELLSRTRSREEFKYWWLLCKNHILTSAELNQWPESGRMLSYFETTYVNNRDRSGWYGAASIRVEHDWTFRNNVAESYWNVLRSTFVTQKFATGMHLLQWMAIHLTGVYHGLIVRNKEIGFRGITEHHWAAASLFRNAMAEANERFGVNLDSFDPFGVMIHKTLLLPVPLSEVQIAKLQPEGILFDEDFYHWTVTDFNTVTYVDGYTAGCKDSFKKAKCGISCPEYKKWCFCVHTLAVYLMFCKDINHKIPTGTDLERLGEEIYVANGSGSGPRVSPSLHLIDDNLDDEILSLVEAFEASRRYA